jgi:hypothetical protein
MGSHRSQETSTGSSETAWSTNVLLLYICSLWALDTEQAVQSLLHASLYHFSFRMALSSRATLLFMPQLDLTASVTSLCCSSFSFDIPLITKRTNTFEQSNLFDSWAALHLSGSSLLNRFISLTSSSVIWYRFSYGFRTGGGSSPICEAWEVGARAAWMALRRSSFGRKMVGVWYTLGMLGGGL